MDVGFITVEPVPGKVHAERTFGVDQHIRARRAAPAELAQQRGLPAHTRPPRLQRGVQEVPQARMNVRFAAVEHVLGKAAGVAAYRRTRARHAATAFALRRRCAGVAVYRRTCARRFYSAAYRRLRKRG